MEKRAQRKCFPETAYGIKQCLLEEVKEFQIFSKVVERGGGTTENSRGKKYPMICHK